MRRLGVAGELLGRHYLSNATCLTLTLPRLVKACFVVSRTIIICHVTRPELHDGGARRSELPPPVGGALVAEGLGWHYSSTLIPASCVLCVACRVKDHHSLPFSSPPLKRPCVRQVTSSVLEQWFPQRAFSGAR